MVRGGKVTSWAASWMAEVTRLFQENKALRDDGGEFEDGWWMDGRTGWLVELDTFTFVVSMSLRMSWVSASSEPRNEVLGCFSGL